MSCRIQNPDIPRADRFWAAPSGAAGRGEDGQDRTPTGRFAKGLIVPLATRASNTIVLNVFSQARTNEILCKPQEEGGTKRPVDPRLVSGLSPGRRPLFVPGCRPVCRRLVVFVNPHHIKHIREYARRLSEWYL